MVKGYGTQMQTCQCHLLHLVKPHSNLIAFPGGVKQPTSDKQPVIGSRGNVCPTVIQQTPHAPSLLIPLQTSFHALHCLLLAPLVFLHVSFLVLLYAHGRNSPQGFSLLSYLNRSASHFLPAKTLFFAVHLILLAKFSSP